MPKQLGIKQAVFLLEAARRYDRFHPNGDITTAWTGLGYLSEYQTVINGGYMVSATTAYPRCKRWFRLTTLGAAIVKKLLYFGINSDYISSTELPTLIKKINYAYKLVQSESVA